MAYATVAEAEVRIAELESENKLRVKNETIYRKDSEKLAKFLEAKGFDPKGDLDEQWESTNGKSKTDIEKFQKELDKQTKITDRLMKENEDMKAEKVNTTIKGELSKRLSDVVGSDDTIEAWVARGKVKLVDNKIMYNDDGADIPIDTHIAAFKKNNPDRIKVNQNSGGGSHNGGEQRPPKNATMKNSDFKRLSLQAKDDFLNKGGETIPD